MDLETALRTLAAAPGALAARAALAAALEPLDAAAAADVREATARCALQRGHFYAALTLVRRHTSGETRAALLAELAARFGATRPRGGRRVPPPVPAAKEIEVPEDPEGQRDLA